MRVDAENGRIVLELFYVRLIFKSANVIMCLKTMFGLKVFND